MFRSKRLIALVSAMTASAYHAPFGKPFGSDIILPLPADSYNLNQRSALVWKNFFFCAGVIDRLSIARTSSATYS